MMIVKPLLLWREAGGWCTLAPLGKPFTPEGFGFLVWYGKWCGCLGAWGWRLDLMNIKGPCNYSFLILLLQPTVFLFKVGVGSGVARRKGPIITSIRSSQDSAGSDWTLQGPLYAQADMKSWQRDQGTSSVLVFMNCS